MRSDYRRHDVPGEYADLHPDQPALVMATSGESLTFAEFEANANRLAHLYRAAGLRRGDHVALFMENHLRYFETMSAAERAGLYYTCVNSYLTPDEVAYIVDDSDAKVFITSAGKSDVAVAAAINTPKVGTFLCVDADHEIGPFRPYDDAVADFPSTRIDDEQLGAAMLYSSGTTGRPKGILRPLPEVHPAEQLPVMQFVTKMFQMRPGMTLPLARTHLPLRPAGVRGRRTAPRVDVDHHGALRPRGVPAGRRGAPHHPHPDGADDVQPPAEAARRGATALRHVLAGGRSSTPPRRARCPSSRR